VKWHKLNRVLQLRNKKIINSYL